MDEETKAELKTGHLGVRTLNGRPLCSSAADGCSDRSNPLIASAAFVIIQPWIFQCEENQLEGNPPIRPYGETLWAASEYIN